MSTMSHLIASDNGFLGGSQGYLPWSISRLQTASACLAKFYKVYMGGEKETSPALTLGGLSHDIIAHLLSMENPTINDADNYLNEAYSSYAELDRDKTAFSSVRVFFPYMLNFVDKWHSLLRSKGIKKAHIEEPYGITRELTRAPRIAGYNDSYIRGVVDLWSYDSNSQTLYVVDHKTSKSAKSANAVSTDMQLNLYVALLTITYKMPWKQAWISLNFLRKEKIVWACVHPEDINAFFNKFLNTLDFLESEIFQAENEMVWPPKKSFRCGMCTFKPTCQAYNSLV